MANRKRFNTTSICIPSLHYMEDMTDVVDRIIADYIEQGEYFTINRARQYGKTTTLELLYHRLKEKYIVIDLSFEATDEYFRSLDALAKGLIMDISERLKDQGVSEDLLKAWERSLSEDFPLRDFGRKITELCGNSDREVILAIDEVDKSADNQIFLLFLGLLREKYLKQRSGKDHTFKSVILAGVYDIKNMKLKLHALEETKYNSPWNIAADFNVDMSLSETGIRGMLEEYEKDCHTGMDVGYMSRQLHEYTSGYPYLVSRLCKIIDEQVVETTRLYNYYLSEEMLQSRTYTAAMQIKNQFVHGNVLDMELVLKKFVEHFSDIYGDSPDSFVEENGRRLRYYISMQGFQLITGNQPCLRHIQSA